MNQATGQRDWISILASIGAPTYVLFRFATGGWDFAKLFALGLAGMTFFYLCVVMRRPVADE